MAAVLRSPGTAAERDHDRLARGRAGHEAVFGRAPEAVAFAPGRVNLIGEHTDYNGGHVLPVAIELGTTCAVSRRADDEVHVHSEQVGGAPNVVPAGTLPEGWLAYVVGCTSLATGAGWLDSGLDIWLDGEVPLGAGLSSSAALECAVLSAIRGLSGPLDDRMAIALMAQRAENEYAGVPCGIMDQATSMLGRADHAVLLDSGRLTCDYVPLHAAELGLSLVLVNTNARHELNDGGYANRRASCELAARQLGVGLLAELDIESLPAVERLAEPERRRARHVVTEQARVAQAVRAFADEDLAAVGALFAGSHRSLAQDFEVSCPELDVAVASALSAGALAARMTGGGFGGSVIALARPADEQAIADAAEQAFAEAGFAPPTTMVVAASDGARLLG